MRYSIGNMSVSVLALAACCAHVDSRPALAGVKEWLARKVISANLPLEEVQSFTEDRVPRMPAVNTAEEWQKLADQMRAGVLDNVVYRGEAAKWRTYDGKVDWLGEVATGQEYRIRKLRYEALPGLWIPALLYEPKMLQGKVPVVLNVNGHDGNGKAAVYKQIRCINLAKRGMLALNPEWLGMGQLSGSDYTHYKMNQLDLCGTSGLAPFYLAMRRGLDVLLSHKHSDPKRVAVAGLSGGGWQTIILSSLDTRVTLTDPVAGYSSFRTRARHFSDLGDSEQTPSDLATIADYAHLTAMMAPRATLLTFNHADDCCFASGHALPPLLDAARPIFNLYGASRRLRWHVNHDPGNHNFERDNREAFYRMLGDSFFSGDAHFERNEIASDKEVKQREELNVELPANNANFHTLALALCRKLPRDARIPADSRGLANWKAERRERLRQVVQFHEYTLRADRVGSENEEGITATFWRFRLDDQWTVPAVELVRGAAKTTSILVSDAGRAAASESVEKLLQPDTRIIAIDPFYFGESKIAQRDFLFGLLVAAVGERPLGLQASQLTAIARWASDANETPSVRIYAIGPRSCLFSLIAAALAPDRIAGLTLIEAYKSLKDIIEQNLGVHQAPELFCFGLLEEFDISQLLALVKQ